MGRTAGLTRRDSLFGAGHSRYMTSRWTATPDSQRSGQWRTEASPTSTEYGQCYLQPKQQNERNLFEYVFKINKGWYGIFSPAGVGVCIADFSSASPSSTISSNATRDINDYGTRK